MLYEVKNGTVSLGGNEILSHFNFRMVDDEKIGIVGRNGAGKTTLLKLMNDEVQLDYNDDNTMGEIVKSKDFNCGYLKQQLVGAEGGPARKAPTVSGLASFAPTPIGLASFAPTVSGFARKAPTVMTVYSYLLEAFNNLLEMERKIEILTDELSKNYDEKKAKELNTIIDSYNFDGGNTYVKELKTGFKKFGFTESDLERPINEFSGGQITKISLLKLLLSKPDVLILDEPTNHLDIEAIEWMEKYLKNYKGNIIVVSHDRMFLDNICNVIYDIENKEATRYEGNYTNFVEQKEINYQLKLAEYNKNLKEIERLTALADRFRYKATKAKMVQSKDKVIEKLEAKTFEPLKADTKTFDVKIVPNKVGGKEVLRCAELVIGYDKGSHSSPVQEGSHSSPVQEGSHSSPVQDGSHSSPVQEGSHSSPVQEGSQNSPVQEGSHSSSVQEGSHSSPIYRSRELCERQKHSEIAKINLIVNRHDRVAVIGANGTGKSTFIKTIVGVIPKISGEYNFGHEIEYEYFDQRIAENNSTKTIFDDFSDEFPTYNNTEIRNRLGRFLFGEEDIGKRVCDLSGGEKVRLCFAKIFERKPNLLILDEPTNHLDILGKESLERIIESYDGTVIFVSHDRYFTKKISNKILYFENALENNSYNDSQVKTTFFEFGYEDYEKYVKERDRLKETDFMEKPAHFVGINPISSKAESEMAGNKLSYSQNKQKNKDVKKSKKLEEEINELEKKVAELEKNMGDEKIQKDFVELTKIQEEINEINELIGKKYEDWDALQ